MIDFDNTYVKIDLDVIEANFAAVAEKTGTAVMAVVKADAYGHGAVEVARVLEPRCAFSECPPCWKRWSCGRRA